MAALDRTDQEPLLKPYAPSSSGSYQSNKIYGTSFDVAEEGPDQQSKTLDRSVESDVVPETSVVGRNLGWSSAYILLISRVIGSGIFATPGSIVQSVGSVGITLVLWVVGALFAWMGLAINLEYGCALPRSGGDVVYLEFVYRRPRFLAPTMIAVQSVCLGFTASNCIVFAEYVLFAKGGEATAFEMKFLAAGLLTSVIILHSCFLKTGIFIQNCLGWLKIALVIFMVLTGFFVVFLRPRDTAETGMISISRSLSQDGLWTGSNWNWGVISTAFFKVFYSYNGLQNVNSVLNEVKNPVKTLKSAASTALLTACILYVLVNIAYFLVVPIDEIADSGELIAALFFQRVFGAQAGRVILPIAVALSAAGNVMVVTFAHARIIQEIARRDLLPFGGEVVGSSKPFGAPMGALLVHYVPSLLVILLPAGQVYSFILDVEGFPAQLFAIASSLGLIWLRFKRPDLRRPYKAFLPAVWMRIALSFALVLAPFVPRKALSWREHLSEVSYAFVGTAVMCSGVLYWFLRFRLLPHLRKNVVEQEVVALDDGTTITKFIEIPRERWKPASPVDP